MSNQAELADRIAAAMPRLVEGASVREVGPGIVRVVGPPLRRGPIRRTLARLLRWPDRLEVELDDVGTWVVDRLDGRSMHDLAEALADHLKLTHREAEAALTVFFQSLLKRKLITLEFATEAAAR